MTLPSIPQRTFVRLYKAELEAMQKMHLTGVQWDVFLVIAREAWGWRKDQSVKMSYSEIARQTGHHKTNVTEAVAFLRQAGIVRAAGQQRAVLEFSIASAEKYHLVVKRLPVKKPSGSQIATSTGSQATTNLVVDSGVKSQSLLINNPNKNKELPNKTYIDTSTSIEGASSKIASQGDVNSFDSQGKTTYSPETPSLGATTLRERVLLWQDMHGPSRVCDMAKGMNISLPKLFVFFNTHREFPRISKGVYGPPVHRERPTQQPAPSQDKIIGALKEGPKSPVEICHLTNLPDGSVRVILSRLKGRNLVIKTGKQYALKEQES